jgi:hypothetical protein
VTHKQKFPTIVVRGDSLDHLKIQVEESPELIALVNAKLGGNRGPEKETPSTGVTILVTEQMAKSSKIKVMISSRCNDRFPLSSKSGLSLSELREKLKKDVEATSVLGERPYEVWIHEKACESAWGPDADRRAKLLIYRAVEGAPLDAYSHTHLLSGRPK